VARGLGIDEEIIESARVEISRAEAPTREIISRMEKSRRRTEKERRRAEKVRRRVQKEAKAYEERREEVEALKEALDREAELEVDRVVRSAREQLESVVKKLKNVPQTHRPLVDELEERVRCLLLSTPLGEKREAFARSLHKGDEVYVPKFRARGVVKKINKGERHLVVLIDGIPTELGFDDISWVDGV
jgi:DNA mismatch repair protein MutS2